MAEYGPWRAVYESVEGHRLEHGCTAKRVWRSPEDANSILVLHEFPTVDLARAFASSRDFKEAVRAAGVASVPRIEVWEDIDG